MKNFSRVLSEQAIRIIYHEKWTCFRYQKKREDHISKEEKMLDTQKNKK